MFASLTVLILLGSRFATPEKLVYGRPVGWRESKCCTGPGCAHDFNYPAAADGIYPNGATNGGENELSSYGTVFSVVP